MHDIVIVGGGLVGSSLAIALDGCGFRVALVEAALPKVSEQPSYDERNLALARASINALTALGVWAHTKGQAAPIERIHISRRGEFGAVNLVADELGLPAFGAVLPARELGNALLHRLDACQSLERIAPAQLTAIESTADTIELSVREGERERRLSTRLLVGADGTGSFVRGHFGIGVQRTDYVQSAFVTTLTTEKPLDGRAFERFTDSGPVAMLPCGRHQAGLVLTVPTEDSDRVAALDDTAFIALVHERFGYRLGRLSRPGKRKPYPLARVLADRLTAERMVLVGNAAQTVHPLGAQGFNLGLRDALSLSELLIAARQENSDPGNADLLQRYVERRTPDREATTSFSDDLVRLMGNKSAPLRVLRSLGFVALERLTPLKRRVALRGMGFRGDVSQRALSR
ncbi:MAG TPA: 2-octaprenyl-6-methoxyphenyl hydroxylase [Dokdonella sp.]|uniref:2-octaprenyl-6-methoxyphenyl hydroxylase n=1 Tax=Dokdonella sp. TaxID=2291710 RepID=UPI002D8046C5|nr:2-octaprenyl-6-methoxyphenyl hydroxylase [Dokdonella sp.]HET9033593.1 2-octaprenyl-6-methoxyphenyl hydroxylase [Dokdonella sp.]